MLPLSQLAIGGSVFFGGGIAKREKSKAASIPVIFFGCDPYATNTALSTPAAPSSVTLAAQRLGNAKSERKRHVRYNLLLL